MGETHREIPGGRARCLGHARPFAPKGRVFSLAAIVAAALLALAPGPALAGGSAPPAVLASPAEPVAPLSGEVAAAARPGGGFGLPAGPPASTRDTVRVSDDLGQTLVFPAPPRRVVSLVPTATEILFALGAGDLLVGRTRYGVHPPEARRVPSVGEGIRPSEERVVEARPEVVVLFAGQTNAATVRRFRDLGLRVLGIVHNDFADLVRNVERLGRLTGRDSQADSLLRRVRCQMATVTSITDTLPRRSVYYDLWWRPARTVGKASHIDSLISLAGGRNVFSDLRAPSSQVNLETILDRNPEVILRPEGSSRTGGAVPPEERPGWKHLEAVREGRVRQVDADLVHRLGPRIGEAAADVAAALHPGTRADLAEAGLLASSRDRAGPPTTRGGEHGEPNANTTNARRAEPCVR